MCNTFQRSTPASLTLLLPYPPLSDLPDNAVYKACNSHPTLLTTPYFLKHFQERLQDGSQIINLDHTTVEHFDIYEHWLLTSEILLVRETDKAQEVVPTKQQASLAYSNLLYCYSLACMLGDKAFLDALITELVHKLRRKDSIQLQFIRVLTQERIEILTQTQAFTPGSLSLLLMRTHVLLRFTRSESWPSRTINGTIRARSCTVWLACVYLSMWMELRHGTLWLECVTFIRMASTRLVRSAGDASPAILQLLHAYSRFVRSCAHQSFVSCITASLGCH